MLLWCMYCSMTFFRILTEEENGVVHDGSWVLLLDKNITLGVTAFELQKVITSTAVSSWGKTFIVIGNGCTH